MTTLVPTARATAVTKPIPSYLKLHIENRPELQEPSAHEVAGLAAVRGAFQQATGWALRVNEPPASRSSEPFTDRTWRPTHLELAANSRPDSDLASTLARDDARQLAAAIDELFVELQQTRHALWQREAELAAGVPVSSRNDEEAHLAERLEAVLKGGAEAVGGKAAALYLLDEATSHLKLRASWGLPRDRFVAAPRPLRGAIADLEALVGHAVVLEDTSVLPHWKAPESFPAAVCLPVSSPTTLLGTMWVFADQCRDFTTDQANVLEIVAGRLAAELEREVLLQQGTESKRVDRQLATAVGWQESRLPSIAPLLDGWQVAGWASPTAAPRRDFYDWTVLPDSWLALAVGEADGRSLAASLTAATLHAALRSHGGYRHHAKQMLDRINETLWTSSAGDAHGSLFYTRIDPPRGRFEYAVAGQVGAVLVRGSTAQILSQSTPALGTRPESTCRLHRAKLSPGDALIFFSTGIRSASDDVGSRLSDEMIAAALTARRLAGPEDAVARLRDLVAATDSRQTAGDYCVLAVQRSSSARSPRRARHGGAKD